MDIHNIFTTPIDINSIDLDVEWKKMLQREAAINKFERGLLQGNLSLGEIESFADNLAEHDIEPYEYWDCVTENIDFVITNQIPLDSYGLG